MLKRIFRIIEDPSRIKRAIQRRMPGVVNAGKRAVGKKVQYKGLVTFKKEYKNNPEAMECFDRELLARKIFKDKNWIVPISEAGEDWFTMPCMPDNSRLDIAAVKLSESEKLEVARQALSILLDIHEAGYMHGDFYSKNLFWYQGQLLAIDFEKLTEYPDNARPPFQQSYDLTGNAEGFTLPGTPGTPPMYYAREIAPNKSLVQVLGIPLDAALSAVEQDLMNELKAICATFQSHDRRHFIRSERIYNSFNLPYFSVDPQQTQRNSAKRLKRVGMDERDLKGASLLDLGCNIGGSLLEAQNFAPARSLGVEYDENKVALASRIAAYNGLDNVSFMQANVDEVSVESLHGPYDVVFCLALVDHVKKKDRLYELLGNITSKVLFFEGNKETPPAEIEEKLISCGFKEVNFLGVCDDDCIADNNNRPVYMARK